MIPASREFGLVLAVFGILLGLAIGLPIRRRRAARGHRAQTTTRVAPIADHKDDNHGCFCSRSGRSACVFPLFCEKESIA